MNNKTPARVSISAGNSKLGQIPSVSLPACVTCNPSAPCFKKCYAVKLSKRRASVRDAYARNLDILRADPGAYWAAVHDAAAMSRYFRYHVSGDIPDARYFAQMVQIAQELPKTQFLAFTKQAHIVNAWIDENGALPENLKIIVSNWGAWRQHNPHELPACEIVFKGSEPAEDWKICGGNCTECACRGVGCWELKRGETIAIHEH